MTRVRLIVAALAASVAPQTTLAAQQFAADDVPIVAARACQLEAWHGTAESWILPACRLDPPLELALRLGWLERGDERSATGLVQLAATLRELTGAGSTVGVSWTPPPFR